MAYEPVEKNCPLSHKFLNENKNLKIMYAMTEFVNINFVKRNV